MRIDFANKKIIITPIEDKMLDDGGQIKATLKGQIDELREKVTFDLLVSYTILSGKYKRELCKQVDNDILLKLIEEQSGRTIDNYNNVIEKILIYKLDNETYLVQAIEDDFQPSNIQNCEVIMEG
jgi:hypothetical protein